jgi:[ribosomal protein S5]-alanine N-acetyltransferase
MNFPEARIQAARALTTDRFDLEPIVPHHAEELFAGLAEEQLYTFIPDDPPADVEVLRARFRRWEARGSAAGDEVWLNYAVRNRELGALCGTLQATVMAAGFAYIAYFVFRESWGAGIARESCREMIRFLFETFEMERVVAHVDTRNERSIRLLEAMQFQCTETIPNADTFKGGSSDEHVFTLTRAAWAAGRGEEPRL